MSYLITIPRWTTFALLVLIVLQVISARVHAKKTGKSFRATFLPNALMAIVASIIFVREWFTDVPVWVDAPLAILCLLLIVIAVSLWAVRFKHYLQESWRLEEKKDK